MNILFLASNDGGNGVGGHYNSLNQVCNEVAKEHNTKILTFGSATSPVLAQNKHFGGHIQAAKSLSGLFKVKNELKKVVKEFNPDIVHCFDSQSLNRILPVPSLFNVPVVFNKCGGKNPLKSNYQHADSIVVFSPENKEWFTKNPNYNKEDIFLIPNRVQKLEFIDESSRKEQKKQDKITFVRISRLGGAYEKTLLDTFNLVAKLSEKYPVELIVIGRIQDRERFEKLVKAGEDKNVPVTYITDDRAVKGSDFLYLADFVVGTGRSFMEATSLGIPSLTPVQNADYPMLVNSRNFQNYLNTNFSERNRADDYSLSYNISNIEQLIESKEKYAQAKDETLTIFKDFFGTESILPKYNAVYKYALQNRKPRMSLITSNLQYLFKFILGK
ncbi:hypothetical protein KJK34_06605 [Flavobacterium sp. D11R37]|uniref:hypothetical protein n=1 Tax=Flavobacterium coralii TaxID=2838017 RepID=UPI001CA717A5|nr:hypothetical protein [Flavobacterium coralii]MBY8962417.1 hypothetical protein [Flavobacterium coralii]